MVPARSRLRAVLGALRLGVLVALLSSSSTCRVQSCSGDGCDDEPGGRSDRLEGGVLPLSAGGLPPGLPGSLVLPLRLPVH